MSEKELNLFQHLEELRKRIIIVGVAFVIFFAIGLMYAKDIYLILMANYHGKLLVLGPSDIIKVYFQLGSIIAFAGIIPITSWQIWLFVKPGLHPNERKLALGYIPALFLLFVAGISFGYFFIFPNILRFLTNLGNEIMITNFTADKYFSFLINITLPFGIAFELPLVMMFLTSLGIINPYNVAKLRKYAYFILVIIATLISPPEFISHLSVAVPLILIYEISISLSKLEFKRKQRMVVKIQP
ncbi:twin-arginine translocase subunit TatC [Neobacillus sp. PS3-12]|jgi:sec-independent protein translocase protein TatC|uniref:twin-arginine translocase subunit TatC n=1 Tax=Neobacillus sp. PS3-12 TaxID=3070677 RepID=UPI0027DF32A8|nr:twin-arginine translocase subunit TatC [Neobacillus sp. PS3-12]WML54432.1 twin-arginine translocase subunit TatC [Neobacillus sp. PS3-12]